jgi:hypothetical protein
LDLGLRLSPLCAPVLAPLLGGGELLLLQIEHSLRGSLPRLPHARVTNRRHVPIVAAAATGIADVVRYLAATGASRHSRTSAGETAQSAARSCDRSQI